MNQTEKRPRMSASPILSYSRFAQIPEALHTPEDLFAWVDAYPLKFYEIPVGLVTDEMRLTALKKAAGTLSWIEPSHTPNYTSLVLEALSERADIILGVEVECLDESFIYEAVCREPQAFIFIMREGCERFNNHISQRIVDAGAVHSLRTIYRMLFEEGFNTPQRIKDMITDEHLKAAVRNCSDEIKYLKRMGRLDVLTQMFRDGYWPSPDDAISKKDNCNTILEFSGRLPTALEAWRERVKQTNANGPAWSYLDEDIQAFFEAVIRLYDLNNVLPWMTDSRHIEALKEVMTMDDILELTNKETLVAHIKTIYSVDELRPLTTKYPLLKGIVLEFDLGI